MTIKELWYDPVGSKVIAVVIVALATTAYAWFKGWFSIIFGIFFRRANDCQSKADKICGLGDLERKLGNNKEARDAYSHARALYQQVGDRLGEANTLMGMGRLEEATDQEAAKRLYYQAEHIYQSLRMYKQEQDAKIRAERLSAGEK